MALQQKKHKIRFGVPEGIACLLLMTTVATGLVWRLGEDAVNWHETAGTLVHAAYRGSERLLGTVGPDVELRYRYSVGGQAYQGLTVLGPVGKSLLHLLPGTPEVPVTPEGFVGLDDLPPEFRNLLESRGVVSLDRIPDPIWQTLNAKGYTAVKDMPPAFREAMKKEDYVTAAKLLDEVLPPGLPLPSDSAMRKPASVEAAAPRVIAAPGDVLLKIKYDPLHPFVSRLDLLPSAPPVASLAPFVLCAVLSVLYCGWGYPRMKRLVHR